MKLGEKAICTKGGECGGIYFLPGDELTLCGSENGFHLATEDKNGYPVILLCHTYGDVHIPVECGDEYYDPGTNDNLPEFQFESDIISGIAKFRSPIDKKETRSRRVQLLMKPSIYSRLKNIAEETNHSFNNVVESALNYALNGFVENLRINKKGTK